MTAGGVQFGVDVVIDPAKAKQGGTGVEDALKRIERQAERTNRLLARGMTRQSRDMGVLRESLQGVNTRTRTVTKSTVAMGGAMKKTGQEGELSLERIIKGQVKLNAATLASVSSIMLMGSMGAKAMSALSSKVEEGYGQVVRLGKAWKLARQTGDWRSEDHDALTQERSKAEHALETAIKAQSSSSNARAWEGTKNMIASVVSGSLPSSSDVVDRETSKALKALEAVAAKERAVSAAIKEGVDAVAARTAAAKSLHDVQELGFKARTANAKAEQKLEFEAAGSKDRAYQADVRSLIQIRQRGDITKEQFEDELGYLKSESARREANSQEATASADLRRRAREAELKTIVGIVGGLDSQYAAEVRVLEVTRSLHTAVRDYGMSLGEADRLIQKLRDSLADDLNPEMKKSRELMHSTLASLGRSGRAGLEKTFSEKDARDNMTLEAQQAKADARKALMEKSPWEQFKKELKETDVLLENTLVNSINSATDAIVEFGAAGDYSLKSLQATTKSLLRDLAKMGLQAGLKGLMGSFQTGGSFNTGNLPGYQTGGSFMVGGAAGVDKTPVMIAASRNERVDITTPGRAQRQNQQSTAAQPVNVHASVVFDPRQVVGEYLRSPQGRGDIQAVARMDRDALRRITR